MGVEREDNTTPQLSRDGRWWWNGQEWLAAISADGLWRWDGRTWRCALQADDPAAIADALDTMAEEKFEQAGSLLAAQRDAWVVPTSLRALVDEAHARQERVEAISQQLAVLERQVGQGLTAVLGRLSGAEDERNELARERAGLQEALRPLLVDIGGQAPEPTFKEADEILSVARSLSEKARRISSAIGALAAAEKAWADDVEAAEAAHDRLQREAGERSRPAEEALSEARRRHEARVEAAYEALRLVRIPPAGEPRASFGSLTLFADRVGTPAGAAALEGATVEVDAASGLRERHGDLLDQLLRAGAPAAEELLRALAMAPEEPFLFLRSQTLTWLEPAAGAADAARSFCREVDAAARESARTRADLAARARGAEKELRKVQAGTAEIEAAEARLEELRQEGELRAGLAAAERRVAQARDDTAAVEAARAELDAVVSAVLQAPEPVGSAAGERN